MLSSLRLTHHRHTGKLQPHDRTSYIPLGILLFAVGLILTVCTANAAHPDPQDGSIGLAGAMPAKPPTVGATIKKPTNGQRFSTSPVEVSGTCPADILVEIFKNDIFAGSTFCESNGTFAMDVDLMIGQNKLVAKVYDTLDQAGPDSNIVSVFYDALPEQSSGVSSMDFGSGSQLILNTDAVFRGTFPGQTLNVPISVMGGRPPYAVNVQWGDTTNTMTPRNDNIIFASTHVYKKAGNYRISMQATDADGRVAFLSVAAVVNGQPDPAVVAATDAKNNTTFTKLLALWPLYVSSVAIVASFWLGEMREKKLLSHRIAVINS